MIQQDTFKRLSIWKSPCTTFRDANFPNCLLFTSLHSVKMQQRMQSMHIAHAIQLNKELWVCKNNFIGSGSNLSSVGLSPRFWEAISPMLQPFLLWVTTRCWSGLSQWKPRLLLLNHPWIVWWPYNMGIATPCSSVPNSPGYNGMLPSDLVQRSRQETTTCSRSLCLRCSTPEEKASSRE